MDVTGFDGHFEDDDDDHDSDNCLECHALESLTEDGIFFESTNMILDQSQFMAISLPELDMLRMDMIRQCLTNLTRRGLAPISAPCCRWRSITGKDGQPFVFDLHVTIFAVRKLGFTEAAGDALELLISKRTYTGDDD